MANQVPASAFSDLLIKVRTVALALIAALAEIAHCLIHAFRDVAIALIDAATKCILALIELLPNLIFVLLYAFLGSVMTKADTIIAFGQFVLLLLDGLVRTLGNPVMALVTVVLVYRWWSKPHLRRQV
ncbi:uncharacterized protein B0H64DRAFT_377970 [Chaetomium fimeti]|uniref:Uncharacterized protein n=1 Tax=Chaetomium fimeti TaxID=1854472 RepID=A0AAE0H7F0_9PEZI|nr:hypothetical protein B0H64DRAFT_377970 [Chaetomium fimeti]